MRKPPWAIGMRKALDLARQAEDMKTAALELRCQGWVGGVSRCTFSRGHVGLCDHRRDDLP